MRRLTRLLAFILLLACVVAWVAVAEAHLDLVADRGGLRSFNSWFGVGLSDRPVWVRAGGFIDTVMVYRLRATPGELEQIVRAAGLEERDPERECLDRRDAAVIWWRPAPAGRLRCFGRRDPPRRWHEVAYEPATGLLYAQAGNY